MSDLSKIFKGWPPEQGPVVSNLELEAAKTEEFEVSPMVLGLMLSFLLFVIAFWIWLISRSCLVAQPVKPNRERKPRQEAGQSAGISKSLGRILNKKGQSGSSSSSKQKSSSQLTLPQFKSPRLSRSYYMGLDRMENYKLRFESERTSSDSKTITQSTFNTGTGTGTATATGTGSSSLSEASGGVSTGNTTSKTGTGSSSLPESSSRLSKESSTGNNNYTTGMSSSPHGCLVTNRSRTAGLPMKKYRIRWANMANQKIDLAGRECQEWMTKVCAHCSSLLPDAEEAALWDSWWPDELPSPYKSLVNYMSAFDCHKLRREVARLVEQTGGGTTGESAQSCTPTRIYRYVIVATVVCVVLALMMCIVWIVVVTFRHRPVPHQDLPPPKVCPADVEAAQSKKSSSESATLRRPVKLPFAGESGSRTHFGLHRKNSSIEAGCLCNQDNISLYPEPGTAQSSGSREQLSSRYN